jgi:signal transduction histidine kinase
MDASAILLCSRRLQVIQANPAAEAVLGYHLDALRGQPLDAILAFPAAARRGGGDDAAWPTGGMMVTLRRADGTVLDCLASTAEVPSSAGPLLLVVVHPETARRPGGDPFLARLEFQASLGALAHGAVNEAHGVLMRVLAACDRLPSRAKDPAVAALRAEAERVTGALREFMLYAQGTAGDRKSFAVGESVDRVLRLLAYELRARQVAVDWKPEPDLPPAAGDAAAFTQVVTGLVRNAADAAEPGPGSRGLRIRAGVTSGRVWVEVADDGPGIDPSIRPRLFEPFVTTKPDGTGLGLHAARRLLGDMGGAIAVEHGTSGGTTVRVELPAAAAGSIPAPRADGVESAPGRVYAWDHELVGVGTNGCNGAAHRKAS